VNKKQINELVRRAQGLEEGQGLTITPGGDILVTNPGIVRHPLLSEFFGSDLEDGRIKSGSHRSFKSIVKDKDLRPEEIQLLKLIRMLSVELDTIKPDKEEDSTFGKVKVYTVRDSIRDTTYEVVTHIKSNNILFIHEPDKRMKYPIPSYLHKVG